jgi:hypothetical protein
VADTRSRQGLVGAMVPVAAILAVLMLAKFLIVKPISFLLLAVLFGVSAYLVFKGKRAGTILLLLLAALTAVIFGAHLIDKGLDSGAYQNTTDFIVILLGFPLSLVAIGGAVIALRGSTRSVAPR